MDAKKRERYEKISIDLTRLVGGKENIQGVAHCATRLRIVLKDNDQADLKAIEDVDLAKGVFVAGDQVQIIFGAGLVNDVYEVFAEHNNMKNMSLSDLKTVANKKMNPLQRIIKALSDVFVDIMPGILAAALLTGLSGVLGNLDFVKANETLFGINRLINISSGAIFGFLPLAVAYSACKRFGGRPILGIVMGCIMLSNSLADAYAAAQGTVEVTTLRIFGLGVDLVGFQGGIIVALLMGFVTAKLDIFFEKKVPEVIRLLLSPLLTTLVGAILLFTIIGPAGRGLSSGITNALDDPESGRVWICGILRPAAIGCDHRPASYFRSDRGAASGGYGEEFHQSADVRSDHRTGRRSTGLSGNASEKCKGERALYPKFYFRPVWNYRTSAVRYQLTVSLSDHRRLYRRSFRRNRRLLHQSCSAWIRDHGCSRYSAG
jgi:glucose-like phosphotransferase system IIB component